jgi:Cu2+-exporting ATPase
LSFAAFAGWFFATGDARFSLNIAIATLIITCPCALGLAVPAVSTAAAGKLFRAGLLVKNGTALERIAETDVVVFDKTGTLTEGQLEVAALETLDDTAKSVALALAQNSTHPVAQALAIGLDKAAITPAPLTDIVEFAGKGLRANFGGQEVLLGSATFTQATPTEAPGAWLRIAQSAPVHLTLTASLRDGAVEVVETLQAKGTDIHLISGDTPAATQAVANALGITRFQGEQSPADKVAYLDALAAQGRKVLMVGDGLNDTGALASAYASVAPAAAADAARAASDVVLLGRSLSPLPDLIHTSRSAKRRILENFAIAAGYNAIVIPLAVSGFVTHLLAAIAMSSSSITVVLNAMRVTRGAKS